MGERWGRQLADKYGMILLVPNATLSGRWDVIAGFAGAERAGETEYVWTEDSTSIKVLKFREQDVPLSLRCVFHRHVSYARVGVLEIRTLSCPMCLLRLARKGADKGCAETASFPV